MNITLHLSSLFGLGWRRATLGLAFSLFAVSCLFAQDSSGIRVITESAIPYAGFLSKANFDQRFPGEMKVSAADLDSGWYVIYTHESLSYYFGPMLLESTGLDYLDQMTQIVHAAVQQRPEIVDYRLELSYEPSESEESGEADNAASGTSSPPPAPPLDIWGLVRSVFGF